MTVLQVVVVAAGTTLIVDFIVGTVVAIVAFRWGDRKWPWS